MQRQVDYLKTIVKKTFPRDYSARPHDFNVAKIASSVISITKSLMISVRVAGPLVYRIFTPIYIDTYYHVYIVVTCTCFGNASLHLGYI